MRTVLTPLALASNVQGTSCTCVLCKVGALHPRLHNPYSEIQSASTTSDILCRVVDSTHQAICKTLLMYILEDMERCNLFFVTS